MTRNYSQFYTSITERLLNDGAELVQDVPPRYKEFTHEGHQVFLPYYHKYAYTVFYGEKVFYSRSKLAQNASRDFEVFLKRIVNERR